VHALLVAMLRGDPDLILDSCSVRAKRGGDLTGPNPTDRGEQGTKYHIATTGDGVPVACAAMAANVNDTLLFERLFLSAFAVVARLRTVFADKGYDAGHNRDLCRAFGAEPRLHKRGRPRGSGLGKRRWPVERSNAWVLENKRLALRYDRLGFLVQSLLQAAWRANCDNRLQARLWPFPRRNRFKSMAYRVRGCEGQKPGHSGWR
jgi:transposase